MIRRIVSCILLLATAAIANAQGVIGCGPYIPPTYTVGLDLAASKSWYDQMPLMGSSLHGAEMVNATGSGFVIGITGTKWLNAISGVRFRIGYVSQHVEGELERTAAIPVQIRPAEEIDSISNVAQVRIGSSADYSLLHLSMVYVQEFASLGDMMIRLLAGPTSALVIASNQFETIDLLGEPMRDRFVNLSSLPTENQGQRLIAYNDAPVNRPTMRFGILAGLEVDAPLSSALSLNPAVEYEHVFNVAGEGEIAEPVRSLYGRLSLSWKLF